jgi:hypothetical protein
LKTKSDLPTKMMIHEFKVCQNQRRNHSLRYTPCQKNGVIRKPSVWDDVGYLMFLKRKRCGKIKARGCADGRKQRRYATKDDAASPTVSNEAAFITAMIDALEDREVAVADLPGAFMQEDMDTLVHVRFVEKMVELLLKIGNRLPII